MQVTLCSTENSAQALKARAAVGGALTHQPIHVPALHMQISCLLRK
jgi:hypothetical protein